MENNIHATLKEKIKKVLSPRKILLGTMLMCSILMPSTLEAKSAPTLTRDDAMTLQQDIKEDVEDLAMNSAYSIATSFIADMGKGNIEFKDPRKVIDCLQTAADQIDDRLDKEASGAAVTFNYVCDAGKIGIFSNVDIAQDRIYEEAEVSIDNIEDAFKDFGLKTSKNGKGVSREAYNKAQQFAKEVRAVASKNELNHHDSLILDDRLAACVSLIFEANPDLEYSFMPQEGKLVLDKVNCIDLKDLDKFIKASKSMVKVTQKSYEDIVAIRRDKTKAAIEDHIFNKKPELKNKQEGQAMIRRGAVNFSEQTKTSANENWFEGLHQ